MRGKLNKVFREVTKERNRVGYICLIPSFLHLSIFILFPIIFSLYLSFHEWDMMSKAKPFVGLGNYIEVLFSRTFQVSMLNTVYYSLGHIPLLVVTALALALLLNRDIPGKAIYRVAFYIPVITPIVAASIIWMWLYEPNFGIVNFLLRIFGIVGPAWLKDPTWAMPAVIIMRVWKNAGFYMVIYLAALQGIPTSYYEAARIDGASWWAQIRYITVPLLLPTTFFILVISLIRSFQVFTQIFVMTQGGPLESTTVVVYYLFVEAFTNFRMGLASAVAYVIFIVILTLTLIQWRWFGRDSEFSL